MGVMFFLKFFIQYLLIIFFFFPQLLQDPPPLLPIHQLYVLSLQKQTKKQNLAP